MIRNDVVMKSAWQSNEIQNDIGWGNNEMAMKSAWQSNEITMILAWGGYDKE